MFRLSAAALVALACLAGTAQSATPPILDGTITIQKLSGLACAALPVAVGQKFAAIYRTKVEAKHPAEVLQIAIPDGVIWAMADKAGDKTFRGRPSNVTGTLIYDTRISPIPTGSETRFTSQPAQPTATTPRIILTGTYKNFVISNCVATLRGVFNSRT